ncbi:MAG: hypothetical protein QOK21_2461 [Solirubrobacteraceae bacterium]|nr:hypothetical protein [Solirubrobacteraceae bacterium]
MISTSESSRWPGWRPAELRSLSRGVLDGPQRHGRFFQESVRSAVGDAARRETATRFDVIVTDSLLTLLSPEDRRTTVARWRSMITSKSCPASIGSKRPGMPGVRSSASRIRSRNGRGDPAGGCPRLSGVGSSTDAKADV